MRRRLLPIPLILLVPIVLLIIVIVAAIYRINLTDEEILSKFETPSTLNDNSDTKD